ncbi:MAG: phosphoglucosamine mutase [Candidatus Methanomethylicota archaeon]|uniref:Phosphoglucosamine mutase n=1 Tax=Thermoproteota archaeon TaxID=2056631 RepID=A0A497EWL5_9CREN|nr:MAG: phosphoglucosamine mutase [Candidatus Verstraetearchaeota archaeon]
MGKLFGTNGIRGKFGEELTVDFVVKVALAIGTYFNGGSILVGYDGRLSSPAIKEAVVSGLLASGCNVIEAGMLPTPTLQFGVKHLKCDGGVMITASHNPPEFNGIKVMGPDGVEISREEELKIEDIYFSGQIKRAAWNELGKIDYASNIIDDYVKAVVSHVNVKHISAQGFKVVADPGNGVTALTAPKVLEMLNCEVILINDVIDGRFPGRGPEPIPKVLGGISKIVREVNADLGVSYDGDGDRAIFTDEKGVIHWGDKSGAVIEKYVLEKLGGGLIVTPVSSSKMIEDVAIAHNGKVIWTKVGSVVVSHKLKEVNGILGIEENGGVFYPPHQPVRDGAMTTALILNVMAEKGEKLSELIDELPKYYNWKDKVPCPNNLKKPVIDEVLSLAMREEKMKIDTIDGVKIWIDENTWVLIRASGTEPIIRVYAEAKSEDEAIKIVENYKRKVREIIGKLGGRG